MIISSVINKMICFVSGLYQWGIILFSREAGEEICFLVVVVAAVFKIIGIYYINAIPSSFNPQSCQEMKFLPLYHASGRKYWCACVCVCVCSRDACEILELTSYFMKGNLATMWVSLLSKPSSARYPHFKRKPWVHIKLMWPIS